MPRNTLSDVVGTYIILLFCTIFSFASGYIMCYEQHKEKELERMIQKLELQKAEDFCRFAVAAKLMTTCYFTGGDEIGRLAKHED